MSRHGKRQIAILMLVFAVMIGVFLLIEDMKWKAYEEEYNSTEWYEVTAEYDHYYMHKDWEVRTDPEGQSYYEETVYYDWYYTYTAEDGSVHQYVEEDRTVMPSGGGSTTILVDKFAPSHSLKKMTKETHNWAVGMTVLFLLICMGLVLGIVVLTLVLTRVIRGRRK